MAQSTYFCPDCGWEGSQPICEVCGSKTESLDIDPITGKVAQTEDEAIDEIDDIDEDWDEGDDDNY